MFLMLPLIKICHDAIPNARSNGRCLANLKPVQAHQSIDSLQSRSKSLAIDGAAHAAASTCDWMLYHHKCGIGQQSDLKYATSKKHGVTAPPTVESFESELSVA
jgi:hypothetical protein